MSQVSRNQASFETNSHLNKYPLSHNSFCTPSKRHSHTKLLLTDQKKKNRNQRVLMWSVTSNILFYLRGTSLTFFRFFLAEVHGSVQHTAKST
jgi:hypothetical protein